MNDKEKGKLRDKLLFMLDETIQVIYEDLDRDYETLDPEVKRVVDVLEHAASTVRVEL
jgi:hypothetical protein